MSKRILSPVLTLLISGYPYIPAIAQVLPANPSTQPNRVNPAPEPPPGQSNQGITIPEFSVIAATFCSAIKFENERDDHFPVTLFLARPIMDKDGSILAPVNSLVNAQVEPTKEGVKIQIDAIVIGGRLIPVKTSALSIPILSTAKEDSYDDYTAYGDGSTFYAGPGRGVAFNVANGLQSWLPNQNILPGTASGLLGAGLAIAAGVSAATDKPKREKVIEVPEGGTLIFPLLFPINLSPAVMQIASSPTAQASMSLCAKDATQTSSDNLNESSDEQTSSDNSNESSDEQTSSDNSNESSDGNSDPDYD